MSASKAGRRVALVLPIIALVAVLALLWRRSPTHGAAKSAVATGASGRRPAAILAGPATEEVSDRPGGISGRIRDPDGSAVVGAIVCVSLRSIEAVGERRCVDTAESGVYAITALASASYQLVAGAPAFASNDYHGGIDLGPGEQRAGIDLALKAGEFEVNGRVLDAHGGSVAGAMVDLTLRSGPKGLGRTDQDGAYAIRVGIGGTVDLTATAEGYGTGRATGRSDQRIDVQLVAESVLTGRVVRAGTGVPVADVRVESSPESDPSFGGFAPANVAAKTDANGAFRIGRLAPGRYKPQASGAGFSGVLAESVLLGVAGSAEVVIEMHPSASVAGRIVIGDTKQGCRRGLVSLRDRQRASWQSGVADSDGVVVFSTLLPGTYDVVEVRCPNFASEETYPPVTVAEDLHVSVAGKSADGLLVWTVKPGFEIRGLVARQDRTPIIGATIDAQPGGVRSRAGGGARSNMEGQFTITGLRAGTYQLKAMPPSLPKAQDPVEVRVDKNVDGVRIIVDEGGTVDGVVEDPDRRPVASATVTALSKGAVVESAVTGADGSFAMRPIRNGSYRLVASRSEDGPRRSSEGDAQGTQVTVASGQKNRVRLVIERQDAQLSGRVVDENGQPVGDAWVAADVESPLRATRAGGPPAAPARPSTRGVLTSIDGQFVIAGLAEGSYSVSVVAPGGEALAERVPAGKAVTLTLRRTGSISGKVSRDDGKPPRSFLVSVASRTAKFERTERFFRTGGGWTMKDLPSGEYEITAGSAEGTAARQTLTLVPGEARADVRFELGSGR